MLSTSIKLCQSCADLTGFDWHANFGYTSQTETCDLCKLWKFCRFFNSQQNIVEIRKELSQKFKNDGK